jgi:hypothetical protein
MQLFACISLLQIFASISCSVIYMSSLTWGHCGCIYWPPALERCETGPLHFPTNILTFLSQNKQWWLMFGFLGKNNQVVREGYRTGTSCRRKRLRDYCVAIRVVIAKISCVSYFVSYVTVRVYCTFVALGTELKIFPVLFPTTTLKTKHEHFQNQVIMIFWNAQLFHKLSHSYMFRHYRVILRELLVNTWPSYATISNASVGNTIYN